MKLKLPHYLLIIYLVLFIVCAINVHDRAVWWIENLTVLAVVLPLFFTYKKFQFSNVSYLLMSVWIYLHTIGGHYTFGLVPFDFVTDLFEFERNHFDRMAHFTVGFFAYPIAELLTIRRLVKSHIILFLFPVFAIFTIASVYEIFEWITAYFAPTEAGGLFLGSQGDIWDPQKDMFANGLGSVVTMIVYFSLNNIKGKLRYKKRH